jgi:hypothetical protein
MGDVAPGNFFILQRNMKRAETMGEWSASGVDFAGLAPYRPSGERASACVGGPFIHNAASLGLPTPRVTSAPTS